MSTVKSSLVVLALVAGVAAPTQAQNFATSSGAGFGYGYSGGYGNYSPHGANSYYGGYGRSAYGRRNSVGATPYYRNVPQTYNNMGGLMNTIRQQTGRQGGYRSGSNFGISRNRRGR